MTVLICTIPTRECPDISAKAIAAELKQSWPSLPDVTDAADTDRSSSLSVGVTDAIIAAVEEPLDLNDLVGPANHAMFWPEALNDLAPHDSHIVVSVSGELDGVALSTLLSQIANALLQLYPKSLGIIWNAAAKLIRADFFQQFVRDVMPQAAPLHLWVDYRFRRESSGRIAGFTTGMKSLGLMEIEATGVPESADDLMHRMQWLGRCQIEQGSLISNGDTIGISDTDSVRIEFTDSLFGHVGKVMSLNYD